MQIIRLNIDIRYADNLPKYRYTGIRLNIDIRYTDN